VTGVTGGVIVTEQDTRYALMDVAHEAEDTVLRLSPAGFVVVPHVYDGREYEVCLFGDEHGNVVSSPILINDITDAGVPPIRYILAYEVPPGDWTANAECVVRIITGPVE